jgi:TetR/AcrR family transcriptional repressor of nem operon
MARPRSFNTDQVVEAAKGVFWTNGYQGTGVEDLERATGLNRSSLYGAFGSKEALFRRALGVYLDSFIDPRLAPMERPGAGVAEVTGFFAGLADLFSSGDATARRGCLMVNSIAEFEGRGLELGHAGMFRDRLRRAFTSALSHETDPASVDERAQLLTATTLGLWLAARIDPVDTAHSCGAVISQVHSWRRTPEGQR